MQAKPQEITLITSENGVWREYKLALAQEKAYSPWQWKRMYKEKMSPGFQESMEELRNVDDSIANFIEELNTLYDLLPKDPTRLADIALILIEINQRIDSIVEAGKQVKPPQKSPISDFYGKFKVNVPEQMRTAEWQNKQKIARAGFLTNFVGWIGQKINEYTDPEIREMKRAVTYLINKTRTTIDTINQSLNGMLEARKVGDIQKYIEGVQLIAEEQKDFRGEFNQIFDSYLKEPYEHALAQEEKERQEAEARGEEYKESFEEVSIENGEIEIIEVEDPAPSEVEPLEEAEDAEETPASLEEIPPKVLEKMRLENMNYWDALEVYKKEFMGDNKKTKVMDTIQAPVSKDTREVNMSRFDDEKTKTPDMRETTEYDPELAALRKKMPPVMPLPQYRAPETKRDGIPPTIRQSPTFKETTPSPGVQRPVQFDEVGGQAPPSGFDSTKTVQSPYGGIVEQYELSKKRPSKVRASLQALNDKKFLEKLAKIAETENKYVVAAFMAKYSEELEETNPLAAAKLLSVAIDMSND